MTLDFSRALEAFALKTRARTRATFVRTAQLVQESVQVGSPLTGAPGQPVDTGTLRNSWTLAIDDTQAIISTNVVYAPVIEDNVRGATLRSEVGGFHSVKMTVAGFERLADWAARDVEGGAA